MDSGDLLRLPEINVLDDGGPVLSILGSRVASVVVSDNVFSFDCLAVEVKVPRRLVVDLKVFAAEDNQERCLDLGLVVCLPGAHDVLALNDVLRTSFHPFAKRIVTEVLAPSLLFVIRVF